MCWHFDKKAQEQIFEDNPVWFEISGMGVMGRFTRPLPLPAPLELPAPYPILPLPDWGLIFSYLFANQARLARARDPRPASAIPNKSYHQSIVY